jgi:hypothetical protein
VRPRLWGNSDPRAERHLGATAYELHGLTEEEIAIVEETDH